MDSKNKATIEIIRSEDMIDEVNLCIEYLRKTRKLTPAQCFVVVKTMYEEFPPEYKPKEVGGN